jgi:uncharacterized YkwD family protein
MGVINRSKEEFTLSKKKKNLNGVLVSVLLISLTACNNDDAALNTQNDSDFTNVVNRDGNHNNLYRVNNGSEYTRTPSINNSTATNNTNVWNQNNDPDSMISNYNTRLSSNRYPHTRSVLTQDARYQYLPVDPSQDTRQQAQLRQRREGSVPAPQQQQQPAQVPEQQQQQPTQVPEQQQAPSANSSQAVQQVIDLTNAQRRQNGLPALAADATLTSVAQAKSSDMQQNSYFSHASPTYGSPFDMMRDQGVSYQSAGENIAKGQRTPQEVVQAWMNSEGHRKNILSRNFTHIGVGYDANGHHWTQMFIEK